jgi:hypothetical protein
MDQIYKQLNVIEKSHKKHERIDEARYDQIHKVRPLSFPESSPAQKVFNGSYGAIQ